MMTLDKMLSQRRFTVGEKVRVTKPKPPAPFKVGVLYEIKKIDGYVGEAWKSSGHTQYLLCKIPRSRRGVVGISGWWFA